VVLRVFLQRAAHAAAAASSCLSGDDRAMGAGGGLICAGIDLRWQKNGGRVADPAPDRRAWQPARGVDGDDGRSAESSTAAAVCSPRRTRRQPRQGLGLFFKGEARSSLGLNVDRSGNMGAADTSWSTTTELRWPVAASFLDPSRGQRRRRRDGNRWRIAVRVLLVGLVEHVRASGSRIQCWTGGRGGLRAAMAD
jgi:hypothetical protein